MPETAVVDLRSDSVTNATPEMRRAMAEAIVGDDGREGDPTAQRLEKMGAEMVGQEAGLLCTSGTMANLVALMVHLRPGEEVLAERESHFLRYEAGSLSVVAGGFPRTLAGNAGRVDPSALESEIQPGSRLRPRTALICLENTHNAAGGACLDAAYMQSVWAVARRHGVAVHLDGERVFNAAVALRTRAQALTEGCQSVMFGLSKGLCAPYGSLLCGSAEFITRARAMRHRLGGNVRQIGHMAAAGIVALETMVDRLADDHANARRLAEGINAVHEGLVDMSTCQTNIVSVDTGALGRPAPEVIAALEAKGVRSLALDRYRLRFVTHHDVSSEQVECALGVIAEVLRG
jgi:threonine aldolase